MCVFDCDFKRSSINFVFIKLMEFFLRLCLMGKRFNKISRNFVSKFWGKVGKSISKHFYIY